MIKTYFKQAWNIIGQNRLFSSIYIIGTALAIAITMTLFVIYYVKIGPVYPEYNRGRTSVIKELHIEVKGKNKDGETKMFASYNAGINRFFIPDILEKIENVDACTATRTFYADDIAADNGKSYQGKIMVRYADPAFWKVFTFDFLCGRPFMQEDMVEPPQSAIISSKLAEKLFASTKVAGREITIENSTYKIVGVVKSPSSFALDSYGEVFVPHKNNLNTDKPFATSTAHGMYGIYFTAKAERYTEKISEDIDNVIKRMNVEAEDAFEKGLAGEQLSQIKEFDVKPFWKLQLDNDSAKGSMMETLQRLALLIFSLLIVPAINLSSMISSRMEERKAEIGVRLAFGATRGSVMKQVLWENMLLTGIGGVVGLLFTIVLVYTGAEWVLTIFDQGEIFEVAQRELNADMLMNPYIFITAFLFCMTINIASAWFPARWALKHSIADSLNSKK